jgi:hypothetical protein
MLLVLDFAGGVALDCDAGWGAGEDFECLGASIICYHFVKEYNY